MSMAGAPRTGAGTQTVEIDGRRVHRLGFGAMRLADPGVWGPPKDRQEAIRVVRRAIELGVDFIDTADTYGMGAVDEILGEALQPSPPNVMISAKIGQVQPRPGEWVPVGRPAFLRQQCELTLRRLRVDRIDLLTLHRVDPDVPFEDQLEALKQLKDEGKIGAVGLSEVSVEQIDVARGIVDVASVQNIYNLQVRVWDPVVEYCEREQIAFAAWYPVASGALTDPQGPVSAIATETGATPTQIALAWLLARSPVLVPIPGTSSVAHLEDNVAAADVRLADHHLQALTEWTDGAVSRP